jgi:hypothetical protein
VRLVARTRFQDLALGARFVCRLPGFLRHPINPEEARSTLVARLQSREADFLKLVRRTVYQRAASPYRRLLRFAGCQYGDLVRLVSQNGVEGALSVLYRHGVYLTVDEFRGRQPVIRGSATIAVDPSRLRRPGAAVHLVHHTSGSRSDRTPVPMDLGYIRDLALYVCLALEARGGRAWVKGAWGLYSIISVLLHSGFGAPAARWFLQVDPAAPGLPASFRRSVRLIVWAGRLAGVGMPRPELVPISEPLPVAHWMAEVLRSGATPHVMTYVTSAVRLCQAAADAGLNMAGAQFSTAGEPLTTARLDSIRRAGAQAWPSYGSTEGGAMGYACLAPSAPDDVHLIHDFAALIQPGPDGQAAGLPANALLSTSLRPTAPMILLNLSSGDQAEVLQRQCGCGMEKLGWKTHLRNIRSFEKLTSGGMTFLDIDVIQVLERALPARFGGGPADYQLVEEEDGDGRPSLRLLVHPAVGPLDSNAVADAFLAAVGAGSGAYRAMELQWRQSGLLRVERRAPISTASGKIQHLHQVRPSTSVSAVR